MAVLVGKSAPDFTAQAVFGNNEIKELKLSDYKGKNYVVLFFYPLDFTFVCPSELIAFDHRLEEFKKRGVQVVPEELRQRLALTGDEEATVVLTRAAGEAVALLVEPF